MYELNNESILNIIKFSNAILTLSKDENNLSFPFSIFYQHNFQLPFKNYVESSFSYLNNEKIIDENQLEKTEYEIDKNSKNNQLIKIILNNYRNKLDLLKKINEKKEEGEKNEKKKDDEKEEKKNKDVNFKKEKILNRTKTPIQNSKEIFNNKFQNTKEDNKVKNINKFNKVINNKKENNINKIDANKLKNNRENELYRKKKNINKSINRSKEKNNNNISTNEMNLTDVVRNRTPKIEKKKKKKKDDYIYFHVDFSELYRKNGEEKLKNYLKYK